MEKFIKQTQEETNQTQDNKQKKSFSLKGNKKAIIIGSGAILILGLMTLFSGSGQPKVEVKSGVGKEEVERTVADVIKPVYEKQAQIEQTQKETNETLKQLNETLKNLQVNQIQQEANKMQPPPSPPIADAGQIPSVPNLPPPQTGSLPPLPPQEKKLIRSISVEKVAEEKQEIKDGSQVVDDLKKKSIKKSVYIPAGSIVEGRLMYGFVAPESGMFPPVVVEFTKPVRTANDYFIPAQKCLITTSAQYDISQGLAILGGVKSTLSCVLKSGKVVQIPVNIAVGEERKGETVIIGLSGQEKWLTGEDYAKIFSATTMSGMANAFRQGLVQQSLTPYGNTLQVIKDRGLYATLSGVKEGTDKFVEFWLKKYDKKVPSIEVQPKEHLFVVFVEGADLKIEPEELL